MIQNNDTEEKDDAAEDNVENVNSAENDGENVEIEQIRTTRRLHQ